MDSDNPVDLASVTEPVDTTGLDKSFVRLSDLEKRLRFQSRALILTLGLLFMTGSGWWLTSNDHTATERNGRVSDCKSLEFAERIDGFIIVASPVSSDDERYDAGIKLSEAGPLLRSYEACIAVG